MFGEKKKKKKGKYHKLSTEKMTWKLTLNCTGMSLLCHSLLRLTNGLVNTCIYYHRLDALQVFISIKSIHSAFASMFTFPNDSESSYNAIIRGMHDFLS